jgi:hypothetical protein
MKPLLTALALAVALPAGAHAFPTPTPAPAPTEKDCCAKMKAEGKKCCCEDMAKGDHADHKAQGEQHDQHQH